VTAEYLHVVALSGGKDSTAMAIRLRELHPETDYVYLTTPTGDELPEMAAHMDKLAGILGKPQTVVTGETLNSLIEHHNALPSWRMRWCTRQLKIQPCLAWIRTQELPVRLYVGLRADEEERKGIYSNDVDTRFPMREWGWTIDDVKGYLKHKGVKVPRRTDCARCYDQRLSEWWMLWKEHPEIYAEAEAQELEVGHTFRSPQRDSWPAGLREMRLEFERNRVPPRTNRQLPLLEDFEEDSPRACRVCSL
jgi:hypothetical protein